jgi:hypothetical protein
MSQAKLNILLDKWAAQAYSDPIILKEETTTGTRKINGKILTARLIDGLPTTRDNHAQNEKIL